MTFLGKGPTNTHQQEEPFDGCFFWATLWEASWCYIKYPTIPKTTPIFRNPKRTTGYCGVISIEGIVAPLSDIEIMTSITLWVLRISLWIPTIPDKTSGRPQPRPYSTLPCSSSWCSGGGKKKLPVVFFGHWEFSNRSLMDLDGFSIRFRWILDGISLILFTNFWVALSPKTKHASTTFRHAEIKSPMWPLPSVREIPNPTWVKRSEDFCWLRGLWFISTPLKIKLEPKDHLFEKEHHLNHPPPFLAQYNLFLFKKTVVFLHKIENHVRLKWRWISCCLVT